jgi:23S rRNA (cytidine1920-2'-O)/16S rRNA (cytidine1409-2'-O)-methyltransferase
MVRRGLVTSRTEAHQLIEAGAVTVDGAPALKASRQVDAGVAVAVAGPRRRFVSRGGDKLDAALAAFSIDVTGLCVLDAGASTGGFTDCALQHGAAQVVAVDVGYGQLHERVRTDPRVVAVDRCNVRSLDADIAGAPFDLVVADLSFISLTKVVEPLLSVCRPRAGLVLLVKPQFEAGRQEVSRGKGIITDPAVRERTLLEVTGAFEAAGAAALGSIVSPILGAEGNAEYLLHLEAPAGHEREA